MDKALNSTHWLPDKNMPENFLSASQWPSGELQPEDQVKYVPRYFVTCSMLANLSTMGKIQTITSNFDF